MVIPLGSGQVNWQFDGPQAPTGAEVTMGFNLDGFVNTAAAAAETLATVWQDNMLAVQTLSIRLATTLVKFGPDDTGPTGEFTSNQVGVINSDPVSPAVAVLVQKVTNAGGRAGRGRFFMPGMAEADVDASGLVDTAYLTAVQTACAGLLADMDANGLPAVLLHAADSPITSPTPITALTPSGTVATQRQRQRR